MQTSLETTPHAMDLNVLDPALFETTMQYGFQALSTGREASTVAANLNNLPRFPNQIGGITIASLNSRNPTYETPSTNDFDLRNQNVQQPSGACIQRSFSQNKFYYTPTELPVAQQPRVDQPDHSASSAKDSHSETATEFPIFRCGERDCNFFRTDSINHNGKYAVAKHYKKAHPNLQFNYARLVSSHTGEKSHRMPPKKNDQDRVIGRPGSTSQAKSSLSKDAATDPALPAHTTQHQNRQHAGVQCKDPQSYHLKQPRPHDLPTNPYTNVPDLHLSVKDFKARKCAIRKACDQEVWKVRRLLLLYCRIKGQSDDDFSALRKRVSQDWIQDTHNHVVTFVGPINDARLPPLGSQGDTVFELSTIIFAGVRRSYMAKHNLTPGTVLSEEEKRRWTFCCELRSMELCLRVCQNMAKKCRAFVEQLK